LYKDSHNTGNISISNTCISKIIQMNANLTKYNNYYPAGPSIMFYNLIDSLFDYNSKISSRCMFWMEHDVKIIKNDWLNKLYLECDNSFWIKGSVVQDEKFDLPQETFNQIFNTVGHINGNALYNLKDRAFQEYIKLVQYYENPLNGYTPFDISLWKVMYTFPYSWKLFQLYFHKLVYSDFILSYNHELTKAQIETITNKNKNSYFIHYQKNSAGNIRYTHLNKNNIFTYLINCLHISESNCFSIINSVKKIQPSIVTHALVPDTLLNKCIVTNLKINNLKCHKNIETIRIDTDYVIVLNKTIIRSITEYDFIYKDKVLNQLDGNGQLNGFLAMKIDDFKSKNLLNVNINDIDSYFIIDDNLIYKNIVQNTNFQPFIPKYYSI